VDVANAGMVLQVVSEPVELLTNRCKIILIALDTRSKKKVLFSTGFQAVVKDSTHSRYGGLRFQSLIAEVRRGGGFMAL